jgi:hypothetical protein
VSSLLSTFTPVPAPPETPATMRPTGVPTAMPPPGAAFSPVATDRPSAPSTLSAKPAGAARPVSRGTCPATHPIKGNRGSRSTAEWIYHLPSGSFYAATDPEECFANEADAQAAGYRRSRA